MKRLCGKLAISTTLEEAAIQLASKVEEMEIITSRGPPTVIGACLFFITERSHDQKSWSQIAHMVDLNEETIKNAYKIIYPFRNEIYPDWWKSKHDIDVIPDLSSKIPETLAGLA